MFYTWGDPLVVFLLNLTMRVIFFVVFALSILYFIRNIRHAQAVIPLLINILMLLVIVNLPFSGLTPERDFEANLKPREKIVSMVRSGQMKADETDMAVLPFQYRYLSKWPGGKILIERNKAVIRILFFTSYGGTLGGDTGFAYISDDAAAKTSFNGYLTNQDDLRKLKRNWYRVIHY